MQAQLINTGKISPKDIAIFEPKDEHYYQPSFTMVGGGVLGDMYFISVIIAIIVSRQRSKSQRSSRSR